MVRFIRKRLHILDVVSWLLVLMFFALATVIFRGYLTETLLGAVGIVFLMLIITLSINVILDGMRNHPRAGELAGYITNGPEALCLLVGLLNHKLMFAVSVPLGSNFANPILLLIAFAVARQLKTLFHRKALVALLVLVLTAVSAGLFYLYDTASYRWVWAILTLGASLLFYHMREEEGIQEKEVEVENPILIIPAILLLVSSGYFLDPVVSYTAQSSRLPEGAIGFLVLSFLSSWPEFRSALSLIQMKRFESAFISIYISNIINLWLGVAGTLIYLLFGG